MFWSGSPQRKDRRQVRVLVRIAFCNSLSPLSFRHHVDNMPSSWRLDTSARNGHQSHYYIQRTVPSLSPWTPNQPVVVLCPPTGASHYTPPLDAVKREIAHRDGSSTPGHVKRGMQISDCRLQRSECPDSFCIPHFAFCILRSPPRPAFPAFLAVLSRIQRNGAAVDFRPGANYNERRWAGRRPASLENEDKTNARIAVQCLRGLLLVASLTAVAIADPRR